MEIQPAGVSIHAFAPYCFDTGRDRVMTRGRVDLAEGWARLQLRQTLAPAKVGRRGGRRELASSGGAYVLDQAVINGVTGGGAARADVELGVDGAEVGVDGPGAHPNPVGDLAVRQTQGDQLQDLQLPAGELAHPRRPGRAASARRTCSHPCAGTNLPTRPDPLTGTRPSGFRR